MPWYAELNKKVYSFSLKSLVSVISLMSAGRLFQTLGAATENARSDETSLERGTTRSCLPAERREARPGMLADLAKKITFIIILEMLSLSGNPQYSLDIKTKCPVIYEMRNSLEFNNVNINNNNIIIIEYFPRFLTSRISSCLFF